MSTNPALLQPPPDTKKPAPIDQEEKRDHNKNTGKTVTLRDAKRLRNDRPEVNEEYDGYDQNFGYDAEGPAHQPSFPDWRGEPANKGKDNLGIDLHSNAIEYHPDTPPELCEQYDADCELFEINILNDWSNRLEYMLLETPNPALKVHHAKNLRFTDERLGRRIPQRYDELELRHPDVDPNCLLGRGLLQRGGNGFIGAGTGIGKSSFLVGAMMNWAIGKTFVGIPVGKLHVGTGLKTLYIQAENADYDAAHVRESYLQDEGLAPHREQIMHSTRIWSMNDAAGSETFPSRVDAYLDVLEYTEDFKPDIIIIDPLFSYAGADVNSSAEIGEFLRNAWLPITSRRNIGAIWAHHSNKPSKESTGRDTSAYILGGSAELANFARFVIGVLNTSDPSVARLVGAKNVAHKVDWDDPREHFMAHVGGSLEMDEGRTLHRIAWRDATDEEVESALENPGYKNVSNVNAQRSAEKDKRCKAIVDILQSEMGGEYVGAYTGMIKELHQKLEDRGHVVAEKTLKNDYTKLKDAGKLKGFKWSPRSRS